MSANPAIATPPAALPAARRRGGRPSPTTAQWEQIIELVAAGNYLSTAAMRAGAAPSTISSLISRYDAGTLRWTGGQSLVRRLKAAAALAETAAVERVRAGAGGWQSAAWWLERRFPDRYGQRTRIDVRATVAQVAALSDQQLAALAADAARHLGGVDALAIGEDAAEPEPSAKGQGHG